MKATDFLRAGAERMDDRAREYDKPEGERSMKATVAAFNAITGRDLTEAEGWLLMEVLKNVRLFSAPGFHRDSAEDGIAYAGLKAEALEAERAPIAATEGIQSNDIVTISVRERCATCRALSGFGCLRSDCSYLNGGAGDGFAGVGAG